MEPKETPNIPAIVVTTSNASVASPTSMSSFSSGTFSGNESAQPVSRKHSNSVFLSITPFKDSVSPELLRQLNPGNIGKGYNILDDSFKGHVFGELNLDYEEPKIPEAREETHFFKNFTEFEKECAKKVGVEYEDGMFSLSSDNSSTLPFLSNVDKAESFVHLLTEFEEDYFYLKIHSLPKHVPTKLAKHSAVKYVLENPFSHETKEHFYQFFDHFGTHYVSEVTFGAKAEYRWTIEMGSEKDAFSRVTAMQVFKKMFTEAVNSWKEGSFLSSPKEASKIPRLCFESKKFTKNMLTSNLLERTEAAVPIAFKLRDIASLFPPGPKAELETAFKVYMEEMKPLRDLASVPDGSLVSIFCTENSKYVRVSDHGNLFAETERIQFNSENTFEIVVKKKGKKFGLKSYSYGKKLISRALLANQFNFHRLQIFGPHETFEITGNHVLSCGSFGSPSYLQVTSEDSQVRHEGTMNRRAHLVLVNATVRLEKAKLASTIFQEPKYLEDIPIQVEIKTKAERTLEDDENLLKSLSLKDPVSRLKVTKALKSNSTSSLFIKDTIVLPNINELTRGMALKVHNLMEKSHAQNEFKFLDEFSEEKFPLTYNVSKSFVSVPTIETIFHFLNTIFRVEKLKPEPGIMCMLYLARILEKSKITFHASNWRRLVISCLILATKVWEDSAVWNVDFIEFFPATNVKDLNRLEKYLLKYLEFNVSVKASEYVKAYFELKEFLDVDRDPTARPLDEKELSKLEVRSASSEKRYLKQHTSMSFASPGGKDFVQKPGLGVLS